VWLWKSPMEEDFRLIPLSRLFSTQILAEPVQNK